MLGEALERTVSRSADADLEGVFGGHSYLTYRLNTREADFVSSGLGQASRIRFRSVPSGDWRRIGQASRAGSDTADGLEWKRRRPAVLSGRPAFFFFPATEAVILKEAGPTVPCVLWQKPKTC
jgi:hypothetical protein